MSTGTDTLLGDSTVDDHTKLPPRFSVLSPGKIVLLGEYAVVDGAPAVVMAIDRGVRCDVALGGDELALATPDGDTRFVRPPLEGAAPGIYRFKDWNPVVPALADKPGFGGSAAACVAACVAAGRDPGDALYFHKKVQGSGSGIDVQAAIHGGLLRVEGHRVQRLPMVSPSVIYSGASARTGPRVERYLSWRDRASFQARSAECVQRFSSDPLGAVAENYELLVSMSREAGIAYLTPELMLIASLAKVYGGAAKPSGAGGGDCAIALFSDRAAQEAFEAACRAEGLTPIAVRAASGAHRLSAT